MLRRLVLATLILFIWSALAMVYFDRFPAPLKPLESALMPWKGLEGVPAEARLMGRVTYMQEIFDATNRVAELALLMMAASFMGLTLHLTVAYQQKQRRLRENELLTMKNREIARRNEFIRYVSATISHEFKNNLGRIKRRLDLLPSMPGAERERIDANMEKLFADIEIFKKISDEREAGLIEFSTVNIAEMLSSLSAQYGDMADISVRSERPGLNIFASPTLLKTVFEAVVDNAIKYKKPSQDRALLSVACSEDADGRRRYVTLSFRDEGTGMSEELADRCFYKGVSSSDGWGHGLYFAKYAVGLHAGKIRVGKDYTAPGVGAEIIINLPLVEEALNV